jgi:hypothetical protein
MSAKVYILLNVSNRNSTRVIEMLKGQKGVTIADMLEGPPDIVLVIAAPDRQKLADRAIHAIASVEDMIENIRLLPAIAVSETKPTRRRRMSKKVSN